MAERAVAFRKVGVAATLQSTIGPTTELILCKAAALGREIVVDAKVIDNVGTLLAEGREARYDQIVGDELRKLACNNDVVVLAQASMARAVAGFGEEERQRFLTSTGPCDFDSCRVCFAPYILDFWAKKDRSTCESKAVS